MMRTIYEALSTVMHIYALVAEKICSCSPEEKEMYYIGQDTMSCDYDKGIPGLPCMAVYNLGKFIYSLLYEIW
jgi:hypothetical protein